MSNVGNIFPEAELAKDFGDPDSLLNSRKWLQKAVEEKGAKFLGGGIGGGQADIDVEIEGFKYNISIRPLSVKEFIDTAH